MRNVQLMKIYIYIYIFHVYHIRIIATKKKLVQRHETDRFLNDHFQECERVYLSIHDCLSFLHEEFKSCVARISFALLYWNTELSAVKYFAICS
jgi:hypothetical protein